MRKQEKKPIMYYFLRKYLAEMKNLQNLTRKAKKKIKY